jgi:hypothetical protein
MAVVVDEAFFDQLVGLQPEKHLTNAEIIWFVVGYQPTDKGWRLERKKVVLTRLEESIKALTGGTPLPREKFELQLRQKLAKKFPRHPLAAL